MGALAVACTDHNSGPDMGHADTVVRLGEHTILGGTAIGTACCHLHNYTRVSHRPTCGHSYVQLSLTCPVLDYLQCVAALRELEIPRHGRTRQRNIA